MEQREQRAKWYDTSYKWSMQVHGQKKILQHFVCCFMWLSELPSHTHTCTDTVLFPLPNYTPNESRYVTISCYQKCSNDSTDVVIHCTSRILYVIQTLWDWVDEYWHPKAFLYGCELLSRTSKEECKLYMFH